MTLCKGDIWQNELGKADLILVPGNSTLKKNGELVMGAGAALELAQRFPDAPRAFGKANQSPVCEQCNYGVVFDTLVSNGEKYRVGLFQSKTHWRNSSDLTLIAWAAGQLLNFANVQRHWRIALCFPGIGLGGLKREDVLPILEKLPDNVFVYEL